ncbi:Bax inhibitor-1/YccA family protein [Corynebacterium tuscaniense]|uniref:Bax inhibitor-1/YccA family protein n=1 Tax=Corynebacterium tuscaniense TaxID=302449 RepID=UPI00201151B4|nr:Bax inhibitor-1/YccA family protein [Corynebacterium tuscaniense]
MKSSNPVLTHLPAFQQQATHHQPMGGQHTPYGQDPYGQQPYGAPAAFPAQGAERPITVDDIVTKTGITLSVIVVFALINFGIGTVNAGIAIALTFVGAIGGLITVLVQAFGRKYGSAVVTLLYAAFEGLFVGGFSMLVSGWMVGSADAGSLILQAVMGTVGVFAGMLFVYKTGTIRVTPKFTRIMTGCIIGVLVLALGNLLLFVFTGMSPLRDGGPLAIVFSLVCIGLAAMSFLTDFDVADKLVRSGAPAKMAWGVALGLAVTLVWLYTEILRLLSYFRD